MSYEIIESIDDAALFLSLKLVKYKVKNCISTSVATIHEHIAEIIADSMRGEVVQA